MFYELYISTDWRWGFIKNDTFFINDKQLLDIYVRFKAMKNKVTHTEQESWWAYQGASWFSKTDKVKVTVVRAAAVIKQLWQIQLSPLQRLMNTSTHQNVWSPGEDLQPTTPHESTFLQLAESKH